MKYKMVPMNITVDENNHNQKLVKQFWGGYQINVSLLLFLVFCHLLAIASRPVVAGANVLRETL